MRFVVIRTNGSDLKIDAPNDDVTHYGIVNELDIIAVNSLNCYHECGTLVDLKSFGTGKFKVEEGAKLCQSIEEITTIVGEEKFAQKGNVEQYEQESPLKPAAIEVTQSNYTTVFTSEHTDYVLSENIELVVYNITIPTDCTVNLDLNGHNITSTFDLDTMYEIFDDDDDFQKKESAIWNKGTLTINGEGNVGGPGGWFAVYNSGTMTINSGTYIGGQNDTGLGFIFYANALAGDDCDKTIINGGIFKNLGDPANTSNSSVSSATICGGYFSHKPATNCIIKEGYKISNEKVGEYYTVVPE